MIPCAHTVAKGSMLCLVRLIIIAMSHAHVELLSLSLSLTSPSTSRSFSSFPLASRTSFCSSSSLSVMSWTKTTRNATEELGPPDSKNSSTSMIRTQHRRRLTMQHVLGGNLGNECADHVVPLALLGSSLAIMSSHVGFVTTLTLLSVWMVVTTSARLLNVSNTFEQMLGHRVLCARCAPHVIHRFVACFP